MNMGYLSFDKKQEGSNNLPEINAKITQMMWVLDVTYEVHLPSLNDGRSMKISLIEWIAS